MSWGDTLICVISRGVQLFYGIAQFAFHVLDKWHETTGKYAITLHNCIPVTDKEKINEQNKSIATGSLYVQTKLGVN